jgi:release factor glutamine methyltransferase
MQVAAAVARARALGVDRLDAQLLLAHRLQRSRTWVIAHDDDHLPDAVAQAHLQDLQQRAAGVPLAYLVGWREFRGLRLSVTPAVLVPRPETELLVDWALELLTGRIAPRVIDLGTGSGAIAIALAHSRPDARVTATDVSAEALLVARGNTGRLGADLSFVQGSWWSAVPPPVQFDLVVSNPPYVAAGDPHLLALQHEPRLALTPGGDGLDALREIAAGALARLQSGGALLLEHGHDQGPAVRQLLTAAGLERVQTRRDLAGLDRCSGGHKPQAARL